MLRQFAPDDAEADRLHARYREYQVANHDRLVQPYEGVVAAIRDFAAAGHPMALVTSKADWLAKQALAHVKLDALIPVVVGCDSCANHKPHPEPVERALALLGATAGNALFVGDSPHDVGSGRSAGVYTVGVTWGAFTREEMVASGADVVIDRFDDLRALLARFRTKPD
jgi:pyrophosphatase PpaX